MDNFGTIRRILSYLEEAMDYEPRRRSESPGKDGQLSWRCWSMKSTSMASLWNAPQVGPSLFLATGHG